MKKIIVAVVLGLSPIIAMAQGVPTPGSPSLTNINTLVTSIGGIVKLLIPMMFAIAILVFFYGVVKYILAAGEEDSKATGRRIMIGGIIALFVIASVWGLVAFLGSATGIGQGGSITPPGVTGI